jgi:hypothetical protein
VPTEGPTSTLGPTVAVADVASHIPKLRSILEQLQRDPGPITLLTRYWDDAGGDASAQAGACLESAPPIPDDYVLPEVDGQASPQLKQVVDGLNTGLALLRQGWTLLQSACQQKTLTQNARAGQSVAQAAANAFTAAKGVLDGMGNG